MINEYDFIIFLFFIPGEDEIMSECEQPVTCEKNPSYYLCRNSHKCIPSRWKYVTNTNT